MVNILYRIKHFLGRFYRIEDMCKMDSYYEWFIVKYYELFPKSRSGVRNRRANRKVIVSMTTIPRRVDKVWITIESLLRQTYKPDQIILWLAKDEFVDVELPDKIKKQTKRGLTIRYCDNLRSYKKFYYTVKENPNAYIVTVDDDVIYAENLLESLVKTYKENPGCVICTRSHWVLQRNGKLLRYNNWIAYDKRKNLPKEPSFCNFYTGVGGMLFPMFLVNKESLLKKDIFMDIAPTADDVWLNFNTWISGLKVKNCDGILGGVITIASSADNGLYTINMKKNDEQITRVLNYMNIDINAYI